VIKTHLNKEKGETSKHELLLKVCEAQPILKDNNYRTGKGVFKAQNN